MEPTAGTRKLVLLLAARRADLSEFRGRFTDLSRERRTRGGGRWSLLLEPGAIVPVPHQEFMRNSPAPYDALIELAAPDFTAAATEAGRSVAALRTLLDTACSNASACDEYCITQGDGPVFVAMQLRRLPALDRTQFMASWFGRHAELGARVEGVRYRQNHIRDAETVGLAWLGLSGPPPDGMRSRISVTRRKPSRSCRARRSPWARSPTSGRSSTIRGASSASIGRFQRRRERAVGRGRVQKSRRSAKSNTTSGEAPTSMSSLMPRSKRQPRGLR